VALVIEVDGAQCFEASAMQIDHNRDQCRSRPGLQAMCFDNHHARAVTDAVAPVVGTAIAGRNRVAPRSAAVPRGSVVPRHGLRAPFVPGLAITLLVLTVVAPAAVCAENLSDAWAAAVAADRRLGAARERTESARATLSAAEGARLPRFTLEGGYTALDNEPTARVATPTGVTQFPTAPDESASYRASLSLPLYTSGRISRGIEAAAAGLDAQQSDEARALADLKLTVAGAYLDVLRARRTLEVAEQNVTSLGSHAVDVEARFRRGLVARHHQLAAQVALADARQRAIRARNQLDLASAAYNRLLGRDLTATVMLEELTAQARSDSVDTLTERALRQRPELHAATRQAEALRHEAAAERAAAWPQLELSLDQRYQENPYQAYETLRSATVGVRWDVFDGNVVRQRAAASAHQAAAAAEERADLASRVRLQVRQAWLDEQETERRIEVAREALAQADENLRVVRSRYREGIGTNTEVLDAEAQREQSYTNYYGATYDAVLADLRLRHALGEL
jgi:outer membrane protein TolC